MGKLSPYILALSLFAPAAYADAAANSADTASLTIGTSTVTDAQEAADQKVVDAVMADFQSGGFPALRDHIDALEAIMAHAPASYPMIERRGSRLLIHTDDSAQYLALTLILIAEAEKNGGNPANVQAPNTYPLVALLLASYFDEIHDYPKSCEWAARGLAMQPYNWEITLEAASCNVAQHKADASLAVLQAALDHADAMVIGPEAEARLLRNKGSSLVELNRLDEAEAALQESIRLLPDNPQAQGELQYIARLRAGGARTDIQIAVPPTPGHQSNPTQAPAQSGGEPSDQSSDKPSKGN